MQAVHLPVQRVAADAEPFATLLTFQRCSSSSSSTVSRSLTWIALSSEVSASSAPCGNGPVTACRSCRSPVPGARPRCARDLTTSAGRCEQSISGRRTALSPFAARGATGGYCRATHSSTAHAAPRRSATADRPGSIHWQADDGSTRACRPFAQRRQVDLDAVEPVIQDLRGTAPLCTSSSRLRWLALINWKSTLTVVSAPSGVTSCSSSTRNSRACNAIGMSPISSRKSVPRSPARSCRAVLRAAHR
jgi:hypothetical protein